MNKKGDEQIMSIWMFIIWIVVGIGIVSGIAFFYSSEADARTPQAQALAQRIAICLSSENPDKILNENFNIFSECNLEKEAFKDNIFMKIKINNKEIIEGNPDIENQCKLQEKATAENFAKCSSLKIYPDNTLIEITTGSNIKGGKI